MVRSEQELFALWEAQYRNVLEHLAAEGDWLFVHYDQALDEDGLARLGAFVDADGLDTDLVTPRLRRPPPVDPLPRSVAQLYDALCARASYVPARAPSVQVSTPEVLVVARVRDDQDAIAARAEVAAQRGARAQLVLLAEPGCTVDGALAARPGFDAYAIVAALTSAETPYAAFLEPGVRWLPHRLAAAVDALEARPEVDGVVGAYALSNDSGNFVARVDPYAMDQAPGPGWAAAWTFRRESLGVFDGRAFVPALLMRYQEMRANGRLAALDDVAGHVPVSWYKARTRQSLADAVLTGTLQRAHEGDPLLTVNLCTFNRCDALLKSLASFARQTLPVGTFEIVLVVDGSTDGTLEALDGLDMPVPTRLVVQPNAGLAAARNSGLAEGRGDLVLFVNDDTIAAPDLVERHLRAHAQHGTSPVAVLGSFPQPEAHLRSALMRWVERGQITFCYPSIVPRALNAPSFFYTCNVSVPSAYVHEVGGFDEGYQGYGCEDTDLGLRLGARGMRVWYEPDAKAEHLHLYDLDYLLRRSRTVARAQVRLAERNPDWLVDQPMVRLTNQDLRANIARLEPFESTLAAAARTLAAVDVAAMDAVNSGFKDLGVHIVDAVGECVRNLHQLAWNRGWLEGLEARSVQGFADLLPTADPRAAPARG